MPYATDQMTQENSSYTSLSIQTNPYNGEQTSFTASYPTTKRRHTWTRSGTSTPGFNNPNRVGLLPVNSYYFRSETSTRLAGSYTMSIPPDRPNRVFGQTQYNTGVFGSEPGYGGGIVTAPMISAAQRKLNTKVLLKIKDQKANLALMYAERAKTKQLLGDTLLKLAKAASKARKGDLYGAARAMGVSPRAPRGATTKQHIATSWLELQYGWRPLVSDMYGLVDMYRQKTGPEAQIQRTKAKEVLSATTTSLNTSESAYWETLNIVEEVVELSMGCTYAPTAPTAAPKSLTQLGITNPAMLAWELLPWSFVVDWFLPIGDYLDSFDATNGCQFVQGYSTTFKKTKIKTIRTYKSSGQTTYAGSAFGDRLIIEITRGPLTAFPNSSFPSFKDPYSHEHFANALALFVTNFRK